MGLGDTDLHKNYATLCDPRLELCAVARACSCHGGCLKRPCMILFALTLLAAPTFDFDAATASYRATLGQLVAADTTNPPGNEARATALASSRRYLKKEGIASEVSEFGPGRKNIVARLKGSGKDKPLILLGHTDVVGTEGQQWSTPSHHAHREGRLPWLRPRRARRACRWSRATARCSFCSSGQA